MFLQVQKGKITKIDSFTNFHKLNRQDFIFLTNFKALKKQELSFLQTLNAKRTRILFFCKL